MITAMKLAIMIHNTLMEERRGCATVARAGGHEEAALAIENQPAPIPSLREVHCFSCAEHVRCPACDIPVMIGKCVGLEPV